MLRILESKFIGYLAHGLVRRQEPFLCQAYDLAPDMLGSRMPGLPAYHVTEIVRRTVYDSELNGEYLGWHSRNLRLVNCRISGTQPLCYAENLILENCIMDSSCDLTFEYSSVHATINSPVRSIKNPRTGCIKSESYGEIIIDGNIKAPADCRIELL